MAKQTVAEVAIDSVSYRVVRDDETESGSVHFWFESQARDRRGVASWRDLAGKAIKTTAGGAETIPAGIPARVLAEVLDKLAGSR